MDWPEMQRYTQKVFEKMELVAVNAMKDRKPVELFFGSVETEGLNFVKHYVGKSKSTGKPCVIGEAVADF